MILQTWKPNYKKGLIDHYTLVNNSDIKDMKGKTAYKVIWLCDNPKCKTPNNKHSLSACHLKKDKMNYNLQICRPCQCTGEGNGRYGDNRGWNELYDDHKVEKLKKEYSEKWKGDKNPSLKESVKIKKNQNIINEEFLTKIIKERGFSLIKILNLKGKHSKFIIRCQNDHESEKTYINFTKKNKKFICEKCFYNSIKLNISEEELLILQKYKKKVRALTASTYKQFKHIINPDNLKIGRGNNHLDHKFSIYEGFKNNVPPEVLSSKENLEVIPEKEN